MPILCPKAQQRPSANSQPPKRCVSCLLRGWKPAFSVGSQGRRFIGRCGATNFCVALEVDKVCPLTLVLQTRVASLNAETQRVAEERREKELSATLCESLRLGVKSPQTASKLGLSSAGEPVSPAAFHRAVALVRLILHDLASTAHARLARSGLEKAMRRLNHTQTEVARLREEMHHRLPGLPESTVQPGLQSHAQNLVDAMFNYVHQHYFRPIGLGDLASAMKMNASYLSALFSQTTGVTFHHFLEEVRLSKAKELLRDPRNLVCDVACATGYASPDSFRHAFKAHEGISPEAWRAGQ
jgi:AraC-like DNA-binding protein